MYIQFYWQKAVLNMVYFVQITDKALFSRAGVTTDKHTLVYIKLKKTLSSRPCQIFLRLLLEKLTGYLLQCKTDRKGEHISEILNIRPHNRELSLGLLSRSIYLHFISFLMGLINSKLTLLSLF